MTFEPAGNANNPPMSVFSGVAIPDLPGIAADRYRLLKQRVGDLRSLTISFDARHDASVAKLDAEQRLAQLIAHRSDGGFELADTDARVINQRQTLAAAIAEQKRLNDLDTLRTEAWRSASTLLSSVDMWLRDGGRPPDTMLESVTVPTPTLDKAGLLPSIEKLRHRRRELKADLHRTKSAPYLSAHAKKKMRELISARAASAAPSITNLIEHDGGIDWASTMTQQPIVGGKDGGLIGWSEPDALGLLIWLHQPALVSALDRLIDEESDDANALTHEQRAIREAEIMEDALAVERSESELVWIAQSQNLPCEHRSDVDVRALLSVRLVVAPRPLSGTSPGYSWDLMPRARR
jgi:hypothetical protein